jgi:putative addiction module killer protein
MVEVRETAEFRAFMAALKDPIAKSRIAARVRQLAFGLWGDSEPVSGGLIELRIHVGPGYRVYVAKQGDALVIVLKGGSKRTQRRDISSLNNK